MCVLCFGKESEGEEEEEVEGEIEREKRNFITEDLQAFRMVESTSTIESLLFWSPGEGPSQ